MQAQLVFLPLLGGVRWNAVYHAAALLVRCLGRLLAAEACQPRAYRMLVLALRAALAQGARWRAAFMGMLVRRRPAVEQQQQQLLPLPVMLLQPPAAQQQQQQQQQH